MKKIIVSKLFLYRHRFLIGYVLLGLAFIGLLFGLPLVAQSGLSEAEIESAVTSYELDLEAPFEHNLVDLPYHLLQKLSISFFGLMPYAIKLPSIMIGLLLGLLLILLLNRWFKNNVSLLASCLVVLSTPFLFLAGSGTPLIMIVFWPTLLLWLGSKIHGETRPRSAYSFFFAIALLLALFTPYMLYFAIFCVLFVMSQPHLRFVVKSLPKVPLLMVCCTIIAGLSVLTMNVVNRPETILELVATSSFDGDQFWANIGYSLTPLFALQGYASDAFLTSLLSLPVLALVLIGLLSTAKGFFASRNSIATLLLVFTIVITGFNPQAIIFLILPITILTAHGLKYLLDKWYGLFPENPYARVSAIIPLSILFGAMIVPSLLQYIYSYRYNPGVASKFSYDLIIIQQNLSNCALVATEHYDFYKILEDSTGITVIENEPAYYIGDLAILHRRAEQLVGGYALNRIITSPMKENSDIIYLYTAKGE